ncbi:MAG: SDR family oxidoreductase, partial [Saprospiraceae bacterium]
ATALKLLRNHANLTVTTRFPALALAEFQKEKDFSTWENKLNIYGLDLRNLKAVEEFINYYIKKNNHLDILINNAAQTIKYDEKYYVPLIAQEKELKLLMGEKIIPNKTAILNQDISQKLLAADILDYEKTRFGLPVDKRLKNSWNSTLEEVELMELLEVNLINHISPYLLIKELTPLLNKSPFKNKFIINVTSSEGQFSYSNKSIFHPHTNMTKAALNMMTRTSAKEYEKNHIFMNSVDVGWVSTGAIEPLRKKQFSSGYIPPLDSVDGAARIIHPMYEALKNEIYFSGKLLKNYKITDW